MPGKLGRTTERNVARDWGRPMKQNAGIGCQVCALLDLQIKTLSLAAQEPPAFDWNEYKAREVKIEALLRKLEILEKISNN